MVVSVKSGQSLQSVMIWMFTLVLHSHYNFVEIIPPLCHGAFLFNFLVVVVLLTLRGRTKEKLGKGMTVYSYYNINENRKNVP